MRVPSFLKEENNALLFNEPDKEFIFYVPEDFFGTNVSNNIAEIVGNYVSMIGICNWAIIDKNGKSSPLGTFNFPTMFLCKPYTIEKEKNLSLGKSAPADYRLLRFKQGDEVVSQLRVPQLIDNVEIFVKLAIFTAKIPNTVPNDKIYEIYLENAKLNGWSYGLHSQLFGLLISSTSRDSKNPERLFRHTDMKDMLDYQNISIRLAPKYISPHAAITSEGLDEGIRAAVIMKDMAENDIPETPLEKIMMM